LVSPSKALIDLRAAISALLLAMVCANAWCQANSSKEANPETKQDRRQELRSTVRQQVAAGNPTKASDKTAFSDSSAVSARQLNSTERTELRRQLASDPRGQRASPAAVEQR
jgi:hypothetical protein